MSRQKAQPFNRADYDVIVIGGGPAGAAAATIVAQAGHSVLVAERATEPQFKVGESLMPATYWTLERLGVLSRMKESHFPAKYSVQFVTGSGRATTPFYFYENDPHESSQTWQVRRSEFDAMLLDNAAEHGAEIRRGAHIVEVLFEETPQGEKRAVGVQAEIDGELHTLAARVVVDATGQSTLIARSLHLTVNEPHLKNVSYYTHFAGARRDAGVDGGATIILHTDEQDSWFWFIPQPDDIVSVGVVGAVDHMVKDREGDPQQVFEEELACCPALVSRLEGARQVMPMKVIRDFSYRSRQIAGDGWVLVGDAFGFLDPIYSSGVFLALKSGEMAGDAIVSGLAAGDLSAARLGSFGPEFTAGMEAMKKLVYAYYNKDFSFAEFLKRHPHCRRDLVNLLIGNVYREPLGDIFEAMAEMIDLPESPPLEGVTRAPSRAASPVDPLPSSPGVSTELAEAPVS